MSIHVRGLRLLCAVSLSAWPLSVRAQIGTTTEIIAGRVIGPDSQAVAGARVEITSTATGVKRQTTTRADGRYTLLFRDGGSQFSVTVLALGMRPATFALSRRGDEDRLVADVQLSRTATTLAQVQVRAPAGRPGTAPASTAGATEAWVPQEFLVRFPVIPGDLTSAATLAPGVTTVLAGDSAAGGISVSGQPANQNNVTLDGGSFLFGTLPQNSVRAVRVVTNAYDPARGQFSGGQIATTTIGGGARMQGTASLNLQPRAGQFPTVAARSFDQRFTQGTAGLGIGGPLVRDRAYYFVSADLDRREEVLASLFDVTPRVGSNLGLAPDSLARFLAFAERHGLAGRTGVPDARRSASLTSLARVDWDITPSSALLLRGDFRTSALNALRVSPLALPNVGGEARSSGGGLFASLTASRGAFIHESRAYAGREAQTLRPDRVMPLGAVTVVSLLDSGRTGQSQLSFGANPSLPRAVHSQVTEVSHEVSWLLGGAHRIKLGALVNAQRYRVEGQGNQSGTFIYHSLADLDAGQPALYARALNGTDQRAGTTTGGVYLADAWRVTPSLQVVYGGRLEITRLAGAPASNPAVAQAFGERTDAWPVDLRVTPRAGFTWLLGNVAGIPAGTVKGGVGLFRGTMPTGLVGAVANGTGLASALQQVICIGAAVPTPDWSAFAAGVAAPESCNEGFGTSPLASARPTVLFFGRPAGAPEVWRASLGYSRQFRLRWAVAADIVYSHGQRAPLAIDRNLGDAGFALSTEQMRPVFAHPSTISGTTGAATGDGSRRSRAFGPALEIRSSGESRSTQVTVTMAGPGLRGSGGTSIAYTFQRVRDMSNGFGLGAAVPSTAGDPNQIEWAASDLERRHQIVAQEFASFPRGIELAVIGRLYSGSRYSPMVNGDPNADGQYNDRAFVPEISGGAMAADMRALLATTDARAATCLRAQLGRVAARNSCTTGWTPQVDVQLNWRPSSRYFDDRLTVSLVASNTLAGLDRALHGASIRGWGQPLVPDRTLLTTAGFDVATQQYRYVVNQRFGTPTGVRNPLGVPFQLALRAQLAIGTDQARANLRAMTGNGGSDSIAVVRRRVARQVPFPLDSLLHSAEALALELTTAQRDSIAAEARRYRTAADARIDEIVALLTANGGRPDLGAMAPRLQETNLALVKAIQESLKLVERILTPAQWAKLPERIRFPFGQQQPGA